MKKVMRIMACVLALFVFILKTQAQTSWDGFTISPIHAGQIAVTKSKLTCVVFPVGIEPAGKGTRDVYAAKVKGTENVIMVKAARPGFSPTNLTVIGKNGRLYSLDLVYDADPPVCNYLVVDKGEGYEILPGSGNNPVVLEGLPVDEASLERDADTIAAADSFLHRGIKSQRMRLQLKSTYIKDKLLWLALKIDNNSLLDYRADFVRFSVRDTKQTKRTASQEKAIKPVYSYPVRVIKGDQSEMLVFGFHPFAVPPHKQLVIQVSDNNGERVLTLPLGYKTILKVRELSGQR